MATAGRVIHPEVPSVVSARRREPSSQTPLLRRSTLAERMATARAEGKLPRRYLHYHPGVAHPVIELDRC